MVHTSPARLQISTGSPGVPLLALSGLALQPAARSKAVSTAVDSLIVSVSHVDRPGDQSVSQEYCTSIHYRNGFISWS